MSRLRREDGLSVIEALVALAIIAVLTTVLYAFQFSGMAAWRQGDAQTGLQQNLRVGMDRMVREIRSAKAVVLESAAEIQVRNSSDQLIRFYLDGTTLKRSVAGAISDLALDITSVAFTYSTDGKLITILLTSVAKEGVTARLQATVYMRN